MKGVVVGFRHFSTGPEVTIKITMSSSGDVLPLNEFVEVIPTSEVVKR